MSQSRDRAFSANIQAGLLRDNNQATFTRIPECNTLDPSLDDALEYPLRIPSISTLNSNRDSRREEALGESLAGLQLSGDDGISNSGMSDSTLGRTVNVDIDPKWLQLVPETLGPLKTPCFAMNSIQPTNTIHSQASNTEASFTPWWQPDHRSEQSSANLLLPTHTPHKSSAGTRSQYSDSAWETIPSPSADDSDTRPMPDDNSASMQSYNDPRTGIWFQENAYGQDTNYPVMRDMHYDGGSNSTLTPSLSQSVQQVLTDADDATSFRTESDLDGCAPLVSAGLGNNGRLEMARPSLLPLATSSSLVQQPHLFQYPFNIRPGTASVIDRTLDLEASLIQQPLRLKHPSFPLSSHQNPLNHIVPRLTSDNLPLSTATLPPTMFMDLSALNPTPQVSAESSTTGVARCTHRGCPAKFTGNSRMDSLRRHKRTRHGNESKPRCPECNLVFESGRLDNLKRHFADKHPGHLLPSSFKTRTRKTLSNAGLGAVRHEHPSRQPTQHSTQHA